MPAVETEKTLWLRGGRTGLNARMIFVANFALAVSQFLLVVCLSRFFGPGALAEYALVMAFFVPAMMLCSAAQRLEILKRTDESSLRDGDLLVRGFYLVLGLICAMAYLVVVDVGAGTAPSIVLAVFGMRVSDGLLELRMLEDQIRRDSRRYMFNAFVRCVPLLALSVSAPLFGLKLTVFWLCAAAMFGLLASSLAFLQHSGRPRLGSQPRPFLVALGSTLPMGAVAGLESLLVMAPRYLFGATGQEIALATYTIVIQICSVMGMAASARLQSDIPRLSAAVSTETHGVLRRSLFGASTAVILIATIGGVSWALLNQYIVPVVFGDWLAPFIGQTYYAFALVPVWYLSAYVGNILMISGNERYVISTSITVVVVACISMAVFAAWSGVGITLGILAAAFLLRAAAYSLRLKRQFDVL